MKTNRQECTAYLLLAVSWILGIMLCFWRLPIPNYMQGFKRTKMKPLHSFMFILQMHKYENRKFSYPKRKYPKDMSSKVNQLWRNHCPPLICMIQRLAEWSKVNWKHSYVGFVNDVQHLDEMLRTDHPTETFYNFRVPFFKSS